MLVELCEMGILNHEEIEEIKKMEGDLEDSLAVILCNMDSDVITKSAEVVTKHSHPNLGKALLSKLCSIANVLLHTQGIFLTVVRSSETTRYPCGQP